LHCCTSVALVRIRAHLTCTHAHVCTRSLAHTCTLTG
jgi:hypothetical protein